jgi:hypothetical protein
MSGTCQVELGDASYSRVAMVGSTLGSRTTNGNPADVLFVKLRSATTKREDGKDDLIVYVCLPKLASGSHVFPASSALFGKGGEVGPVNGHGLFVASSKGRAVAFLATRGSRVELRIEDTSEPHPPRGDDVRRRRRSRSSHQEARR